jgi:hypothetical protein
MLAAGSWAAIIIIALFADAFIVSAGQQLFTAIR